jgi:hypothetical protein
MSLLISSCTIPLYDKYKLSEEQAAIEKSTNIKGEVKIFYAVCRAVEEGIGSYSGSRFIKPIYGITEPHLVDDISHKQWGVYFMSPFIVPFYARLPDIGPHVKIEIVKKDQCYWVSDKCFSTPTELSEYIVFLLQVNQFSEASNRDELVDDIKKLISDAFKKEGK